MGKTVKIECDGCGHDLTYTGNSVDYRLVLANESKPTYPDINCVTDMMIYPSVERTMYFCRIVCLDKWREREHHENRLWSEWMLGWKREHGTWEGERCRSWTVPPHALREEKRIEFEAAALAAVPLS